MHEDAQALVASIAARHAEAVRPGFDRAVLIGLIGRGIASSRSPAMHRREAERLGIGCSYELIDFDAAGLADDALAAVLAAAEGLGFAGLNVTHPFKQAVIGHLAALAPDAAAIGAVNTVVFAGGTRIGHNTDSWGFAESLRQAMPPGGIGDVVQFGAGGGGAAVGHALLELGARSLLLADPDRPRARALAERLAARFDRDVAVTDTAEAALANAAGLVNATPVGMHKYPGAPFDLAALQPRHWVADIVYFPAETPLLAQARRLGCHVVGGTGMAVFQAVRAFELFTGIAPDREAMSRHFAAA